MGLIAVAIAGVVADRIPGRVTLAATFAVAAFGVVAFVTGGAEETEVEVRAVSALAILGVAIAAALTVTSARHGGVARIHRSIPGDRVRVGIAILIGLVSIPWLAADLGIAVDQIPVFNRIFISEAVAPDPGHPKPFSAVHDGHHHGMDGVLIVWSALLLTRLLPDVGGKRLRAFLSPYVALMLVFGLANAIQDFWTEQLFKRAVVSWDMPRFTRVTADPHWIVLLVIAVTAYTLAIRPGALLGRARVPATV